jgi:hypothetical protein
MTLPQRSAQPRPSTPWPRARPGPRPRERTLRAERRDSQRSLIALTNCLTAIAAATAPWQSVVGGWHLSTKSPGQEYVYIGSAHEDMASWVESILERGRAYLG